MGGAVLHHSIERANKSGINGVHSIQNYFIQQSNELGRN